MKGQRTKAGILERAVDLASLEGLEGVSIGRLADDLSMSKSGLFAHFGSKEELQLATIAAAEQRFVDEVVHPAFAAPRGYPRLAALCRSWLGYLQRRVFPGGCFFAAASFEFDGRSGKVRDAVQLAMDQWIATLEKAVRLAKQEGHLRRSVDPSQIAFELNSLFFGANFACNLRGDPLAFRHAAKAIDERLRSLRVKSSLKSSAPRRTAPRRASRSTPHRAPKARGTRRRSSTPTRSSPTTPRRGRSAAT
jgi:AcrR family transcriptional regulator